MCAISDARSKPSTLAVIWRTWIERLGVVAVGGEHLVDLRQRLRAGRVAARQLAAGCGSAPRAARSAPASAATSVAPAASAPASAVDGHRGDEREDRDLGERGHVARLGDQLDDRVAGDHDQRRQAVGRGQLRDALARRGRSRVSCETSAARSSSLPPSTTIGAALHGLARLPRRRVSAARSYAGRGAAANTSLTGRRGRSPRLRRPRTRARRCASASPSRATLTGIAPYRVSTSTMLARQHRALQLGVAHADRRRLAQDRGDHRVARRPPRRAPTASAPAGPSSS